MALPDFEVPSEWLAGVIALSRAIADAHPERHTLPEQDVAQLRERFAMRRCATGNIMLHQWKQSDPRDLHDHAWDSVSIILSGGYWEVTSSGRHWCAPGDVLFRRAEDLHRVELEPDTVPCSLFITGITRREAGFHTAEGWVPYAEYMRRFEARA
jgi:hypothetical protein